MSTQPPEPDMGAKLSSRQVKAAPTEVAGAAFVLTDRLAVLAVVAHDDGVRLKYAGWVPQDDVSDVNVTAVYRRASLSTSIESHCGS
jgi:hypothetical protein